MSGWRRAEVPELKEPKLGDESRHVNKSYTRTRREGALPKEIVVIPDTQIMYNKSDNANIFDLYEVDSLRVRETSSPFVHGVEIAGPRGEIVRFRSVFDDGALVNAIDETLYHTLKGRLTPLTPSRKILRMADGRKVPSAGEWRGRITVKGISREGVFEVFKSNNAWAMLFGKPLLQAFNAIHDYTEDTIRVRKKDKEEWAVLENQFVNVPGVTAKLLANLTVDIKQLINVPKTEPWRQSSEVKIGTAGIKDGGKAQSQKGVSNTSRFQGGFAVPLEGSSTNQIHNPEPDVADTITSPETCDGEQDKHVQGSGSSPVWTVEENLIHPGTEQPISAKVFEPTLLTRKEDPHNSARVGAVLSEVTIGSDLSPIQRDRVRDVIAKYAECFALSMSEVTPVQGAVHRLDIPRDKQFKIKINQRPQTPPQREFFNRTIDKMLEAGIIRPIAHQDVKCCSVTTLAKKAHEGGGRTLNELKHRINEQCIVAGFPSAFEDLAPIEETHPDLDLVPVQTKWRICQDFTELNQVTKVPPMPQGDIRRKQQNLSGHRWITIFDFANGFYACEIKPEDQPYVCFYVEGRGYYAYLRMPFGLTGGPSTFGGMTANALGDLIGILIELFVDDGGMAGDDFEVMLDNTIKLLQRVSETGLSLSATKSKFFVTEATFAGGRVGPEGIKPDLAKLTAITDWKIPTDLQNMGSFLGLAGYFRSLIKGYASIAQPLTDLARKLELPKLKGKAAYTRAMKGYSLDGLWAKEHDRAFLRLKVALVSEPVLKGPKYDGTPFIVTTDGCKYGFAGMLTQKFTTVLPNGTERMTIHPIGFASKRTSTTEEKYKPFILEFAALKYCLDKFSDVIWGYPVELETDCQALRDHLLSSTLNSTHARWRDAVLAHNIVDVRHRPGRLNVVADGLSRKFVNTPKEQGDGHEWSVSEDWEARTGLSNDVFALDTTQTEATYSELRTRFADESVFLEVIDSMLELDHGKSLRVRKRAKHKAKGYLIEDGKLWKLGDGSDRARARLECVTKEETVRLAWDEHRNGGHFHRDNIKAKLLDRITSPKMDQSVTKAILDCGKCKGFGATHLHSLLEPITRRHPFELMVADTLTMPKGKGGYTKLGLWMDVYAQRVWVTKIKTSATGKSSKRSYGDICDLFTNSETLMTDGGPEFDNEELREECAKRGTKLQICPAYSPWVNGLLEGTNAILLNRLKRMCAPDLGEDEYAAMDVPSNWPDHLEEAIRYINSRILPSLRYSPNELLLGIVVNTKPTPLSEAASEPTAEEVDTQMAYVDHQRFDGYAQIVDHALRRKAAFDKRVLDHSPREVIFRAGDLVQVYRSDLDYTFKSERKLLPKFSAPRRVVSRNKNSYQLETLEGLPIAGRFSSRRLRLFIARKGTALEEVQAALEKEWREREDKEDKVESGEASEMQSEEDGVIDVSMGSDDIEEA
jgi:RNase H-like domain found in reverse transcriptase/Reverse transcriptase (RNA-dependent DNA polymerase)